MCRHRFLWLACITLLASPLSLSAQTTTGTIRGYVKDQNGTAIGDAEVQARNVASGITRPTTSRSDGSYILPGLTPATYELSVRKIGFGPQRRQVVVQIGSTLLVDFTLQQGAVELQAVTVEATPVIEMRTSEVATNVTQQQLNDLPTSNRNIFDLTALAPGVITQNDQIGSTRRTFMVGASCPQCADQINVFIDGASYKNDLTRGGVVGQDRSRGNVFARNTIQEFRVLTQNYKAEYQKSSSGVIVATTRSGGNAWKGNAFVGFQNDGLVALDTFQRHDKRIADSIAATTGQPSTFNNDYRRYQVGLSVGGPLIKDRLHLFTAYEGNYQQRTSQVSINPPAAGTFPILDTFRLRALNGSFHTPFDESFFFGKLSYE